MNQEKWKKQVSQHFSEFLVSQRDILRLQSALTPSRKYLNPWISHSVIALLAAGASFGIVKSVSNNVPSSFDEVTSFSEMSKFPADFDLDGDPKALSDMIQDSVVHELVDAEIPSEIYKRFIPKEGRLFNWAGKSGVSIQLTSLLPDAHPAILYIVDITNLDDKSAFPDVPAPKQLIVAGTKSKKKVNAWRKGKLGYALVAAD